MVDRESRAASLDGFANSDIIIPPLPTRVNKPLDVDVARAAADNTKVNTVARNYEIRRIIVAQGIEFHSVDTENKVLASVQQDPANAKFARQFSIPEGLLNDFPTLVMQGANDAVYISDPQRVEYHIHVVTTKDKFKAALETPGVHVIYDGHSRYGRGPCFGPDFKLKPDWTFEDKRGDDWESGTDPTRFGIFRMGYPYVGVTYEEIQEHGYKCRPVPASVRVNPADINPETFAYSLAPVDLRGSAVEPLIADAPLASSYWGCRHEEGNALLLFADWQNTNGQPMDLGATDLQCKCFTHLGCSSLKHFHDILRHRKGYKRTSDDKFAYFTTDVSNVRCHRFFLSSWFEYPERNDFQSWLPSLEWAVSRANQKLAASGDKYRLI